MKMFKTIFRYSESFGEPVVKPAWPLTFDLSSDPHENWNLIDTRMHHAWIFDVATRIIMQ